MVIRKIQIFKGREEGPSDSRWSFGSCLLHHPVNHQVEKQCKRRRTSLSNTSLHTEAGLAVSTLYLIKLLKKLLMPRTICSGIPCALSMCHKLSWWMLSKALSKSTLLMYNCLCHSVHCSMMLRRVRSDLDEDDLVCASSSFSKSCLLSSEWLVHCFTDLPDPAGDRQKGDSSPVVTVVQGSFPRNLHIDTLRPVINYLFFLPYCCKENLCCKLWLCLEEVCIEAVLSRAFSLFEGSDGCGCIADI